MSLDWPQNLAGCSKLLFVRCASRAQTDLAGSE